MGLFSLLLLSPSAWPHFTPQTVSIVLFALRHLIASSPNDWVSEARSWKSGGGRKRERERGIWSGSAKNKPHIRKSLTVIVDQWIGALSQRPFYRVDGGKTGRAMARVHVFLSTAWSHRWTHGDSMRLRKNNISHFKLIYDPPVNTGLADSQLR